MSGGLGAQDFVLGARYGIECLLAKLDRGVGYASMGPCWDARVVRHRLG